MADLPSASRFGDYMQWPGRDVLDADGERLGAVEMIFLDDETNQPEWVRVTLSGDEPGLVMVPLAEATVTPEAIRVAHPRERVSAAPRGQEGDHLAQEQERALYDHYGLAYSEERSASGLPVSTGEAADGGGTAGEPADAAAPAAVVSTGEPTDLVAPGQAGETEPAGATPAPPPVTAGAPPFTPAPEPPAPAPEPVAAAVPAPPPAGEKRETPPPTPPSVTAGAPPFTETPGAPPPGAPVEEKGPGRPPKLAAGGAVVVVVGVVVGLLRRRSRRRAPAAVRRAARLRRGGRRRRIGRAARRRLPGR